MEITERTVYMADDFVTVFKAIEDTTSLEKTEEGYELRYLTQEELADSPDQWADDNLFLVNYHSDFYVTRDKVITEDNVREWFRGNGAHQAVDYYMFVLACLVHSGVWLSLRSSFPCDPGGWDTSHIGVILASKKEFEDEEAACKAAQALVETWNQYLTGDVYCLVRETYDGDKKQLDYDVVGGCYGHEYALKALQTEF